MNWFKEFWEALTVPMPRETEHPAEGPSNFTPRAQQVLGLARKEAERLHHCFVGTEHLLLGLIHLGQGVAVNVLAKMGVDLEGARLEVEKQVGTGPEQKWAGRIPYTPRVKKVLALAVKEARALNHTYVGTEHILLGLLREGDGVAGRILKNLNVDIDVTRQEILRELVPNFEPSAEGISVPVVPPAVDSQNSEPELHNIDTRKRYDVCCVEQGQQVVYQNVLFKGTRELLPEDQPGCSSEFIELEQADGQTVFVARSSVLKFCPHVATP